MIAVAGYFCLDTVSVIENKQAVFVDGKLKFLVLGARTEEK